MLRCVQRRQPWQNRWLEAPGRKQRPTPLHLPSGRGSNLQDDRPACLHVEARSCGVSLSALHAASAEQKLAPYGVPWDREKLITLVEHSCEQVFLGCLPRIHNRTRWEGNDKSVKQLGLFASYRGLLRRVMIRFVCRAGMGAWTCSTPRMRPPREHQQWQMLE